MCYTAYNMANDQMFKEAVEAIRQGQRARARDLLTRLLRTDQQNEQYWLYLSTVVDTDKERRYCLDNALKADPQSVGAQRGLVMLGLSPAAENLSSVKPSRNREWDEGEIYSITGEARKSSKLEVKIPWSALSGVIALMSMVFVLMLLGVFGNPIYEAPPPDYVLLKPTSTPRPLGYNNRTATAEAMATAGITATAQTGGGNTSSGIATATFTGPTPLAAMIANPPSATPFYVVTPHEGNDDLTFGMQNFEAGEWLQAISYFERVIVINPEYADVRYYIGLAYFELEDFLEAKGAFNDAINIDPELGAAYLARAQTSAALRQTGLIADDLNKAVRYALDWPEVYIARAEYRLIRTNPEGALDDLATALELAPDSARANYVSGLIYLADEDYETALTFAQTAHDLDLTLVENYFVLGKAMVEIGQAAEALGHLQTFLTYNPENAEAWLLLAQSQLALEEYDNVLTTLEKVEEIDQTLYEFRYYRGIVQMTMGDYESAIENFQNSVRIYPKWFEAQLSLGKAIFLNGSAANGYTAIHAAFGLAQTDEQLAQLYYWRALSLEGLDYFDQANNDWVRLLDLPIGVVSTDWTNLAQNHINGVYNYTPTPTPTEENEPEATPTP